MTRPRKGHRMWMVVAALAVSALVGIGDGATLARAPPRLYQRGGSAREVEPGGERTLQHIPGGNGRGGGRRRIGGGGGQQELDNPEVEKKEGEGQLENLLEYLELDPVDAKDPRISQPGGLKMTTHTGGDLVFTRDNQGAINVNGAPVDGVMTLKDGTQVFTLERFLDDHKDRLDEAFQFLSSQLARDNLTRAKNIASSGKPRIQLTDKPSDGPAEQLPRPSVNDDTLLGFSVVVSQVTEISSETSPPITARYQPDEVIPATEPSPRNVSEDTLPLTESLDVSPIPETLSLAKPTPVTESLAETSLPPVTESVFDYENLEATPVTETPFEGTTLETISETEYIITEYEDDFFGAAVSEPITETQTALEALDTVVSLKEPQQEISDNPTKEFSSLSTISNDSVVVPELPSDPLTDEPGPVIDLTLLAVENVTTRTEISSERFLDSISSSKISSEASEGVKPTDSTAGDVDLATNTSSPATESSPASTTAPLPKELHPEPVLPNSLRAFAHTGPVLEPLVAKSLQPTVQSEPVLPSILQEGRVDPAFKTTENTSLPSIPQALGEDVGILDVWLLGLHLQNISGVVSQQAPGTVVSPDLQVMLDLMPLDVPHPLYDDNEENTALRSQFLLDYLVHDPVSAHDPRLTRPEGLTVNNFAGKDLTFKVALDGNMTVNDVAVLKAEELSDGTRFYSISNLLFDHLNRLQAATNLLLNQSSVISHQSPEEPVTEVNFTVAENPVIRGEEQVLGAQATALEVSGLDIVAPVSLGETSLLEDVPVFEVNGAEVDTGALVFETGVPLLDTHVLVSETEVQHLAEVSVSEPEVSVSVADVPETKVPFAEVEGSLSESEVSISLATIPETEMEVSFADAKVSVSEPEVSVSLATVSDTETEAPFVLTEVSVSEPKVSVSLATAPENETELPLAITEVSVFEPELVSLPSVFETEISSITVPETEPEVLLATADVSVSEPEKIMFSATVSEAKIELPLAEAELLLTEVEEPLAEEVPLAEVELPLIEVEAPLAEEKMPLAEVELPLTVVDAPLAEEKVPLAEVELPLTEAGAPLAEEILPLTVVDAQLAEEKVPLAEVELPLTEVGAPLAEENLPLTVDVPLAEEKLPLTEIELPLAEVELPLAKIELSPTGVDAPLAEVELPRTDIGAQLAEEILPLAETELILTEVDTPLAEEKLPLAEIELPLTKVDAPLAEVELPLAKVELPPIEADAPLAEGEAPLTEVELPLAEVELPLGKVELPLVEIEAPLGGVEFPLAKVEAPLVEVEAPVVEAVASLTESELPFAETEVSIPKAEVPAEGAALTVPKIPHWVKETESSSLLNIWRAALRSQQDTSTTDLPGPMTILSPLYREVVHLVGRGGPNPLYDDRQENAALRSHLLLDHLVQEPVIDQDPRVTQPEGLAITTLTGKDLNFKSDAQGNMVVNNVPVVKHQILADGTQVYTLADFLFDYRSRVQEAAHSLATIRSPAQEPKVSKPVKDPVAGVQTVPGNLPIGSKVDSILVNPLHHSLERQDDLPSLGDTPGVPVAAVGIPESETGLLVPEANIPSTGQKVPVSEPEAVFQVFQPEIAMSKAEAGASETETLDSKTEFPVFEPQVQVSEIKVPMSETKASTKSPASEVKVPVSEAKIPGVEVVHEFRTMLPPTEMETPVSEINAPVETKSPESDLEQLESKIDLTVVKAEIASEQNEKELESLVPLHVLALMSKANEPVFEAHAPKFQADTSVLKEEESVFEPKVPVSKSKTMVLEPLVPVSEAEVIIVKPEVPISKSGVMVFEPGILVSEAEGKVAPRVPVSETEVIVLEPEVPIFRSEARVLELGVPVSEAEVMVLEPKVTMLESGVPVSEAEVIALEPEAPVSESEVTVLEPGVPVFEKVIALESEIPISKSEVMELEPEILVPEADLLVLEPEVQVPEAEVKVLEPEVPVSKSEVMELEPEILVPEAEITVLEPQVPVSETKVVVLESEVPLPEKEVVVLEPKVSSPDVEVAASKAVVPLLDQEVPVFEIDKSVIKAVVPVLEPVVPLSKVSHVEVKAPVLKSEMELVSQVSDTEVLMSEIEKLVHEAKTLMLEAEVSALEKREGKVSVLEAELPAVKIKAPFSKAELLELERKLSVFDTKEPASELKIPSEQRKSFARLSVPKTEGFPLIEMEIPRIPSMVEKTGASSLLRLWHFALKHQDSSTSQKINQGPMTILSPAFIIMMDLVPRNVPHPLYDYSFENAALRTQFLLDYLIQDPVNVNSQMMNPEGLLVTNLTGKNIIFKMDNNGKITVNGIRVGDVNTLSDGTKIYTLNDLLFDHRMRVDEAVRKLLKQSNKSQRFTHLE